MIEKYDFEVDGFTYSYAFIYDRKNEQDILLRVYGNAPIVYVPEHYTIIGAYCFAASDRLPQEAKEQAEEILGGSEGQYTELCGEYVQSIVLSDSVEQLERYAFYNCKQLEQLEVGKALNLLDSDVFMNCRKLHTIMVRASISEKTGLKVILAQLNQSVEIKFADGASVFYPEYAESYDEISPAHIFAINIAGEGYRARQQFKDGIVDIAGYDSVFEKANALEDTSTLFQMAVGRLKNPVQLGTPARKAYEEFVHNNVDAVMKIIVDSKNLELLKWICSAQVLEKENKIKAMQHCITSGWTAGSAWLISAK